MYSAISYTVTIPEHVEVKEGQPTHVMAVESVLVQCNTHVPPSGVDLEN